MKFYEPETVENGVGALCITFDADGKPTNMGDGHKMAVWAGAAIEQWHAPMIHHMGGGAGADGRGVMGNNGYLWHIEYPEWWDYLDRRRRSLPMLRARTSKSMSAAFTVLPLEAV